jgi:hypothetical protein
MQPFNDGCRCRNWTVRESYRQYVLSLDKLNTQENPYNNFRDHPYKRYIFTHITPELLQNDT